MFGLFAIALLMPSDTARAQERGAPEGGALDVTLECIDLAARQTDLVPDQRERLCFASPSPNAPVACWVDATQNLDLTDQQAVLLCRCAADLSPVACVHELRRQWLVTDPEMITLCSPTIARGLRLDCSPQP